MIDALETVSLQNEAMSVAISSLGAELQFWRDKEARDLLWDGDPKFWTGRAPLLFPMVGRAPSDTITIDGRRYSLPQHGFARRQTFAVLSQTKTRCDFRLKDNEATRAAYPFAFHLDVAYELRGAKLSIAAVLTNDDARPLPASFGFHPALRWPLPYGGERGDHEIVFARDEPEPIRRLVDGLLAPDLRATPVRGRRLALGDALFTEDALVFDRPRSRAVAYGSPGRAGLHVAFEDMPNLGIWSKPGAGFVCIEPWQGLATPASFAGEFRDKPGVIILPSGSQRRFVIEISLTPGFQGV